MPRGDGVGPMGMGPMTGRAAGYCAGFMVPGYASPAGFAGVCGGFGRGRGFRRMFHATGIPGWARFSRTVKSEMPVYPGANAGACDEREILSKQAEFLERQLEQVKKRLSRLKEDKKDAE